MPPIQLYLEPPTARHSEHAAYLYSLISNAITVERKSVNQDDWRPQPNICHQNCSDWETLNPVDTAVRGWLCIDFSSIGFYRFASHSIIRTAVGDFMDITPTQIQTIYPFLEDGLDEETYAECVETLQSAHGSTFLDYKL